MIPRFEIPEPWLTSDPAVDPSPTPGAALDSASTTAAAANLAAVPAASSTKRRRYKVSPKVLAANRQNLVKANAVPNEIRYRSTEKRLEACHRNLEKAVAAKKKDRSAGYAPSLTVGWYVADPERALPLIGATPDEYQRHLRSFRRIVAPRDEREAKLAQALGILSWRWLAALRLEGDREELGVCHVLESLAERRHAGLVFDPREATELDYHLQEILGGWTTLISPAKTVQRRGRELWKQLVALRHEEPAPAIIEWWEELGHLIPLKHLLYMPKGLEYELFPVLPETPRRRSGIALNFDDHSPAVLGGPHISSRRTCARLDSQPGSVAPTTDWEPWQVRPSYLNEAIRQALSELTNLSLSQLDEAIDGDQPHLDPGLPRPNLGALLRRCRLEGRRFPVSHAAFLRLVRAALGPARQRSSVPNPRADREDERRVRKFAEALWERMTVLRRQSEQAEAWLNARADEYAANSGTATAPGRASSPTSEPTRAFGPASDSEKAPGPEEASASETANGGETACSQASMADRSLEFDYFFTERHTHLAKDIDRLQALLYEAFHLVTVERFGRLRAFGTMETIARKTARERERLRRIRIGTAQRNRRGREPG